MKNAPCSAEPYIALNFMYMPYLRSAGRVWVGT